jgi:hypothetical protein
MASTKIGQPDVLRNSNNRHAQARAGLNLLGTLRLYRIASGRIAWYTHLGLISHRRMVSEMTAEGITLGQMVGWEEV